MSKAFYDYPAIYHAAHLGGTAAEAEGVLSVFETMRVHPRSLLEPACGTGRYLQYFGEKGFECLGYDSNDRLVRFARRIGVEVEKGTMESFTTQRRFSAAFTTIGTFRHLKGDRAALSHLSRTAGMLEPGGLYVVGLDLVDYDDCPPDEEGWEIVHRGRRLCHLYQTFPPTRRTRKEKILNFVTVTTRRGDLVLQDEYDLRSYDLAQWRSLIARSPFRLAGTYDASGKPAKLGKATRYALFALKKSA